MSTLEKPGIAWADQQPVRQPVRRCGFRELRPPPGRRAEIGATVADLEGQIAGSPSPVLLKLLTTALGEARVELAELPN